MNSFVVPTEYMDGCAHSLKKTEEEEVCKRLCEKEEI